jgi:1-acyl-sn-glycerol-3-phosphate acyltransferase
MHPDRFQPTYSYIKTYFRKGLRIYFDQVKIVGYEAHVPDEGAVFFASNHQNTFLDPVIISAFSSKKRQPSFITRSDVFNKWSNMLFKIVKMVPIYRQRDGGIDAIRRNEEMFKVYTERLEHEESMVIFPEGDHGRERRVRPLKKGLPRIAFQTLEETNFDIPFWVVPVGLYYGHHDKYHTDLMVIYGPTINVHDYVPLYLQNKQKGIIALRNDLQAGMEKVNIHIQPDHYALVEGVRQLMGGDIARHLGHSADDLYERFQAEKVLIARLEAAVAAANPEIDLLTEEVAAYQAQLTEGNMRDHVVAEAPHTAVSLLAQVGYLIFLLPLFLYGLLNHLPAYLTLSILPPKLLKDIIFHSSMRFVGGLLIVPLFSLIQSLAVGLAFGPEWALAYAVSLLPAGILAKQYRDRAVKFAGRWRMMRRWWRGDRSLSELRQQIWARVLGIVGAEDAEGDHAPLSEMQVLPSNAETATRSHDEVKAPRSRE